MEQDNLLKRLYDQWGGESNLTAQKKKEILADFVREFLPEKPNGNFLKRIISRRISKEFTGEGLAEKLVSMNLATNIEDARELIPDVVSREYYMGNVHHHEFRQAKNSEGVIYYAMKTYVWRD